MADSMPKLLQIEDLTVPVEEVAVKAGLKVLVQLVRLRQESGRVQSQVGSVQVEHTPTHIQTYQGRVLGGSGVPQPDKGICYHGNRVLLQFERE